MGGGAVFQKNGGKSLPKWKALERKKMEFQKLGKRTRRQILRSSRSGEYVVSKYSRIVNSLLDEYLVIWLGIFDRDQKRNELVFNKTKFFHQHPRCKYALLVGFTREWAKGGIENEI